MEKWLSPFFASTDKWPVGKNFHFLAYHKILVEAQVAPPKYFFTRKRPKQCTLPEHNHFNIEGLSSFVFAKRKASGQVGLARGKSHEHQCYWSHGSSNKLAHWPSFCFTMLYACSTALPGHLAKLEKLKVEVWLGICQKFVVTDRPFNLNGYTVNCRPVSKSVYIFLQT